MDPQQNGTIVEEDVQSVYDPNSNPRRLSEEVAPHIRAEMEARVSHLQQKVRAMQAQLALFESDGWRFTHGWINNEVVKAVTALADLQRTRDLQSLGFVQGQIALGQQLQMLPQTVKANLDQAVAELKYIEQQMEAAGAPLG